MALAAAAAATLPSWVWRTGIARAGSVGARGACPNQLPGAQCDSDQFEIPYTTGQLPPDALVAPSGNPATFNGCGPASGIDLGSLHGLEPPDSPLGLAHFVGSCDNHDCCYSVCQESKANCDKTFLDGLGTACAQNPANLLSGIGLIYCNTIAATYYAAVAGGGAQAYETAQRDACRACRPKCQCTGTQVCCHAPNDYSCFDLQTDSQNCGDCGSRCADGYGCVNGTCQ
jgi:hypothetical protein